MVRRDQFIYIYLFGFVSSECQHRTWFRDRTGSFMDRYNISCSCEHTVNLTLPT